MLKRNCVQVFSSWGRVVQSLSHCDYAPAVSRHDKLVFFELVEKWGGFRVKSKLWEVTQKHLKHSEKYRGAFPQ